MTRKSRAPRLIILVAAIAAASEAAGAANAGTTPAWTGNFTDFNSPAWRTQWGIVSDDIKCNVAVGTASCNWGYKNLKSAADPETPGGGQALEVTYPAPSGPPSCNCGIGGAQLYQDLKSAGLAELAASKTIDLKYWYRFPVGFDFGKNTGGKMPGLYGGDPGCQSGGQRCDKAWSTRYMWRGGSKSAPRGELYFYTGAGSGFGEDLGLGSWNFQADGKWHSIEQLVNLETGKITIWHDGEQKFSTTKSFGGGTLTGIFFSTFHGGHDTSWSPSKTTAAYFANFTLSTDGPQVAAMSGPPDAGGAGGGAGGDPADARSEASEPASAAGGATAAGGGSGSTGGASGTGGTPNTGGRGEDPAPGTGGAAGSTGAAATGGRTGEAPASTVGGGCSLGAGAPTGAGGLWLLACVLLATRARRRPTARR